MKITEIIVSAGRTFNHPYEQYSNFRPGLTIKATLEDGEDFEKNIGEMQNKAETMMEKHKTQMLNDIRNLYQVQKMQGEMSRLKSLLKETEEQIKEMELDHPLLESKVIYKGEELF